MKDVDILILGAGWTSEFLLPLLTQLSISHASTTTSGRKAAGEDTIKFKFDASSAEESAFHGLPTARTVLITFPLNEQGPSNTLVSLYNKTHPKTRVSPHFIQLGSTGIWQPSPSDTKDATPTRSSSPWVTRHSPYNKTNSRAIAEDELLSLNGCVLNLSGLWGGSRDPKMWVDRVAATKEKVREKKSLHMVHGDDVARAIVAVHENWDKESFCGHRWLLTDGFVYDWWALFAGWADAGQKSSEVSEEEDAGILRNKQTKQSRWVYELMWETGVKALPRSMEELGRCYDSREFWQKAGVFPIKARI